MRQFKRKRLIHKTNLTTTIQQQVEQKHQDMYMQIGNWVVQRPTPV